MGLIGVWKLNAASKKATFSCWYLFAIVVKRNCLVDLGRLATFLEFVQIEPFVEIKIVVVNFLKQKLHIPHWQDNATEFKFKAILITKTGSSTLRQGVIPGRRCFVTCVISFIELFLFASLSSPFVMKPSLENEFVRTTLSMYYILLNDIKKSVFIWT